jgi:hypothetical protein
VTVFAMVRSGDSDHMILTAKMARVKEENQEREVEGEDREGSDSGLCTKSLCSTRRED